MYVYVCTAFTWRGCVLLHYVFSQMPKTKFLCHYIRITDDYSSNMSLHKYFVKTTNSQTYNIVIYRYQGIFFKILWYLLFSTLPSPNTRAASFCTALMDGTFCSASFSSLPKSHKLNSACVRLCVFFAALLQLTKCCSSQCVLHLSISYSDVLACRRGSLQPSHCENLVLILWHCHNFWTSKLQTGKLASFFKIIEGFNGKMCLYSSK